MTYKVFLFNDDDYGPPRWWVNYGLSSRESMGNDEEEGILFECDSIGSRPRNRYVTFKDMAHYYKFMMKWSTK